MKEEIVYKKVSELKNNPRNPRKNDDAVGSVAKSIEKYGFRNPLIIDENNVVWCGNTRLKASKKLGIEEVPCIVVSDLTEQQIAELALLDNKTNEIAEWDFEMLGDILSDIDLGEFDLDWGIEEQLGIEKEVEEDDFDVYSAIPKEPKAKLGDIYQLGEHRLMCGDSTKEEDVAKLMDGEKSDMVFTDPPYGVNIKGKYTGTILNDNLQNKELEKFLIKINNNLKLFNTGNAYVCYEVLNSVEFFNSFGKPNEVICINKSSASFYSKNKYNRKFELILFYENEKPIYGTKETNVWDTIKSSQINSYDENGKRFDEEGSYCCVHPTAKPISVPTNAIKNSSKENGTVLDLFGGSGSTLIACEQLNRKCYMMELDPHYVDVIIKRWEDFTGKKAVKIN